MKKLIILTLIFLISIISFSNEIKEVSYFDGIFSAKLSEKKSISYKQIYNKTYNIYSVEIRNTSLTKEVPSFISTKDDFVEKISITEIAGITTISFYLNDGVKYSSKTQNGEIKVTLKKGKTTTTKPVTVKPGGTPTDIFTPPKTTPPKTNNKHMYTIVVDAGHGGHDSGASGNGLKEKDVALEVSHYLADALKKDFNVIMTRDSDYFVTLNERPEMGNDAGADLFVSIHLNSASASSANGVETFFYSRKESPYAANIARIENQADDSYKDVPVTDALLNDIYYTVNQTKSREVATTVLDAIVENFGLRRRRVEGANFAVLRGSQSPSLLVEIGFISNKGDMQVYASSFSRQLLAEKIAEAIKSHFR